MPLATPAFRDGTQPRSGVRHRPIRRAGHMRRYSEIVAVLVKFGFVDVVHALHLTPYLAAGRRVLAAVGAPVNGELSRAHRLRLAFEALGPTFIKFGQALSTRTDLLPADVVDELTLLQDNVPPLAPGVAQHAVEKAFGAPVGVLFATFSTEPIAAASIAQVHYARLLTGEVVAVKVRRPGIEQQIQLDLAILADLAALAERYLPDAILYSLCDLVDEFARTITREQDLAREGRLIERITSQFAEDNTVRYPAVYWPLTTSSVLTMEFLNGVKVSAVGGRDAPELDPTIVARRGADIILQQILVHGLFHADPHPGNILVLPGNVIGLIDFGIVGRINRQLREQLTEVILAIRRRNVERLAEIVVAVATPLKPVNMRELAKDLEEMLDAYADVPVGALHLGEVFASITSTMSRHRLKLPADILLLIKSLSTIEGVGRQLDPSFMIVAHATPLVEQLVARKHLPLALAFRTATASREMLKALRRVPADVAELTRRAREQGLRIEFVHRDFDYFIREMDRSSNRLSFAVVIAATVIASAVMVHARVGPTVYGYPSLGVFGFLISGLLGVGLAIGILRSGRL